MTVKVDRYPFTKPLFVKMRLLNAQVTTKRGAVRGTLFDPC
jgi:hypothetical protein